MSEWALLIFTLSLQAAIGCICMLWIFQIINKNKEDSKIFTLFKTPLIVIVILSLVGLGASFAHLGTPTNAFNTLRNIGSSWMSREILFTGAFIGLAVITVAAAFYYKKVISWLLFATALIGLVDVYCMASIYYHSLVGPWKAIHTFTSFYGTTFLLGAILSVSLLTPTLYKQNMKEQAQRLLKISLFVALIGIAFQVIGVVLFSATMTEVYRIKDTVATVVLSDHQGMIAVRWLTSFVGLFMLGYLTLSSHKKYYTKLTLLILLLFVFSEGMSRYIFYLLGS